MGCGEARRYKVLLEGRNYRKTIDQTSLAVGGVTTRVVSAGDEEAAATTAKAIVATDLERESVASEPGASMIILKVTQLSRAQGWFEKRRAGFTYYEM